MKLAIRRSVVFLSLTAMMAVVPSAFAQDAAEILLGYRIEFQFCLGEKSQVKSLYYMSKHHDKLRQKATQ